MVTFIPGMLEQMQPNDWKRIAAAARSLAYDVASGRPVRLNPDSWRECALGEVARRSGYAYSLMLLGMELEDELADAGYGGVEGDLRYDGLMSEATFLQEHDAVEGATVFPLLALADLADENADEKARAGRGGRA